MGKLLYLSELYRRRTEEAAGCPADGGACGDEAVRTFVENYPLGWIEALLGASKRLFRSDIAIILPFAKGVRFMFGRTPFIMRTSYYPLC